MAVKFNIPVKQGAELVLPIVRQAPRLDVAGNPVYINQVLQYDPVDMTGWTGHMQVRTDFDVNPPLVDLTHVVGADGHLLFGLGTIKITIFSDKTFLLKTGNVYDLFGSPPGGASEKIMSGILDVERAVTK